MKLKDKKGSISIFVLVALLFMTAFLILLYSANVNKSKIIQEQFETINEIYSVDTSNAYEQAYTNLRKKNKQILTYDSSKVEELIDKSTIELSKTYAEDIINYQIYGETEGVGNLIEDLEDENYGKYKITIRIRDIQEEYILDESTSYKEETYDIFLSEPLRRIDDIADYIDFNEQKIIRKIGLGEDTGYDVLEEDDVTYENIPQLKTYEDYTNIEVLTDVSPSRIIVEYVGYTLD